MIGLTRLLVTFPPALSLLTRLIDDYTARGRRLRCVCTRVESRKRQRTAIATSIVSFREFLENVGGERSSRSMSVPGRAERSSETGIRVTKLGIEWIRTDGKVPQSVMKSRVVN